MNWSELVGHMPETEFYWRESNLLLSRGNACTALSLADLRVDALHRVQINGTWGLRARDGGILYCCLERTATRDCRGRMYAPNFN